MKGNVPQKVLLYLLVLLDMVPHVTEGMFMIILRRMTFWFSAFSIIIILNDYWETIHASTILLVGVGPFEPFKHWMLDFDRFEPPVSADLTAKFPGYIVHFIFFLLTGTILDRIIRKFRRKPSK
ncbi:hypothetical protein AB6A23_23795 [Paenibacillus tarimensis]